MASCVTAPQRSRLSAHSVGLASSVELEQVPFFPQEHHHCGPAALAMALAGQGAEVTPDTLVPQLYLPEREGSLQMELIAATRRHGYVPYPLAPRLDHLLAEVAAGHAVVVLQNLALSWYPRWHYAVVVGYDLATRRIVLRSGTERRHVISLDRFEHTWARGGYWGMVALPPDSLPETADVFSYLKSVVALEALGNLPAAHTAYATALTRWPANTSAWMGYGNTAHRMGEAGRAEQAFRRLLAVDPDYLPALNNLALVLAEQDAFIEAEALAQRAVELDKTHAPIYVQTLNEIRSLARHQDAPAGILGTTRNGLRNDE